MGFQGLPVTQACIRCRLAGEKKFRLPQFDPNIGFDQQLENLVFSGPVTALPPSSFFFLSTLKTRIKVEEFHFNKIRRFFLAISIERK
ncbi:hypothetical protein [Planomicrobium sp. MB-3u-38]|uniref:hypothetical protein n=1 Tax=Planomicrobium sp. MB-3u-38 TaxID=2058318 RepID=UPI000C7BB42B|nr:hypothetical protein [Planomicrobium sp. MB-3u-38]PKH09744.1 hypothetical protein CXF70_13275 [Planomicrobium sp. MB-3u-38]